MFRMGIGLVWYLSIDFFCKSPTSTCSRGGRGCGRTRGRWRRVRTCSSSPRGTCCNSRLRADRHPAHGAWRAPHPARPPRARAPLASLRCLLKRPGCQDLSRDVATSAARGPAPPALARTVLAKHPAFPEFRKFSKHCTATY